MADKSEAAAEKRILHRISDMVATEKRLRAQIAAGPDGDGARTELHELEVELDRCWDLLRQRRALAEAGEDPGTAKARPAGEVEGYLS